MFSRSISISHKILVPIHINMSTLFTSLDGSVETLILDLRKFICAISRNPKHQQHTERLLIRDSADPLIHGLPNLRIKRSWITTSPRTDYRTFAIEKGFLPCATNINGSYCRWRRACGAYLATVFASISFCKQEHVTRRYQCAAVWQYLPGSCRGSMVRDAGASNYQLWGKSERIAHRRILACRKHALIRSAEQWEIVPDGFFDLNSVNVTYRSRSITPAIINHKTWSRGGLFAI